MMPCIIQDALASPGCTRDEMTTPLRFRIASPSDVKDVIVSISTVLPESVSHSGRRRNRFVAEGSSSKCFR